MVMDIWKYELVWISVVKWENRRRGINNKGQSCYARSPAHVWTVVSIKVGLIVIDNRQHDKRGSMTQGASNDFKVMAWSTGALVDS